MRQAKVLDQSNLSLPPDSYIYAIKPLADNLIASCSDDSIRILDKNLATILSIPNCHNGITALVTNPSTPTIAVTSGRDGLFRSWDIRTRQKVSESSNNNNSGAPILSLALSPLSNQVVVGTELANHQAVVTIWDSRSLVAPVATYVDSHNDDVTELSWHPTRPEFLLSGGTDGLLNLYDTRIVDEEEAVVRTWNHGSVSHALWPEGAGVRDGHEMVYAVSHDEQLAAYRIPLGVGNAHYKAIENDDEVENEATTVGDVRPKFDCEYVIGLVPTGGQVVMGVGKHSAQRVDLVDLTESLEEGAPASDSTIRIEGAHGEEIVRTVHIDGPTGTIFTGGEDGMIRSWTVSGVDNVSKKAKQPKDRLKDKKGDEKRAKKFAPY